MKTEFVPAEVATGGFAKSSLEVCRACFNAHHLRELKALVDIEKEEWALKMQRLLRRACHVARSFISTAQKQGWNLMSPSGIKIPRLQAKGRLTKSPWATMSCSFPLADSLDVASTDANRG